MSYTADRDQFIATVTTHGLSLTAACKLLSLATTINRLAELACSSEAAGRDRIPCPATPKRINSHEARNGGPCLCDAPEGEHESIPRITLQDWQAEQRARAAIPSGWRIITEGDPRGYTLRVIPPSYAERNAGRDRHDLDAIGVPPRESGIKW